MLNQGTDSFTTKRDQDVFGFLFGCNEFDFGGSSRSSLKRLFSDRERILLRPSEPMSLLELVLGFKKVDSGRPSKGCEYFKGQTRPGGFWRKSNAHAIL